MSKAGKLVKRLTESVFDDNEVLVEDLVEFAKAFSDLGDAVSGQLQDVLDGDLGDVNPNAVKVMKKSIYGFHPDIDAAIDDALKVLQEE